MHLAELLVALVVFGLLLGGTLTILQQGQQAYAIGAARVEAQQSARIALARMAAEIRGAGVGAVRSDFAAIAVAEPQRLVLQHDVNGDGAIGGAGETITWRLAAGVLRRDAGAGAQPVINGVRDLTFTYLDADGHGTTAPDAVRTVVIALTAGPDRPPAGPGTGTTATFATSARLRNR